MRFELNSFADLPTDVWRWPHVHPAKEWACKGSGRLVVETEFLDRFEWLRRRFGGPLLITSGYRSPTYNAQVSSTGTAGPHTTGRAMDIRIYGAHAHELIAHALQLGFTGIGLHQKGDHHSRFVHLDDLPQQSGQPRPWIWTY